MKVVEDLKNTLNVIQNDEEFMKFSLPRQRIIELISEIMNDNQENIKTKATILINGFCDAIPESLMIRTTLARLRRELWGDLFGFETIKFLQKNKMVINSISEEFRELMVCEYIKKHESKKLLQAG